VDQILVTEDLQRNGQLEVAGGPLGLMKMVDGCLVANVEEHLDVVWRKWKGRQITAAGQGIAAEASVDEDPLRVCQKGIELLDAILAERTVDLSLSEIALDQVAKFRAAQVAQRNGEAPVLAGLPLPWPNLNKAMGGLEPGMTVLGGAESAGKTAFAVDAMLAIAAGGVGCGYLTNDGSRVQWVQRLLARMSETSLPAAKNGFAKFEKLELMDNIARVVVPGMRIAVEKVLDLRDVLTLARVWRRTIDMKLLVVDFVQKLGVRELGRQEFDTRLRVSTCSNRISNMALDMDIPVLVLSQLRRAGKGEDVEPQLVDLKESGTLEEDAQKVLLLWKDDAWCAAADARIENRTKHVRAVNVKVAKNKDGERDTLHQFWLLPPYFKFEENMGGFPEDGSDPFDRVGPHKMTAKGLGL
jgi:replicative DNA helicase